MKFFIDLKNLKVLIVVLACVAGAITMIAAPAVFAGRTPGDNGTLPPLCGGAENPPPNQEGTTEIIRVIFPEITMNVGDNAMSNLIYIRSYNAVTQVVIRNYCGSDSEFVRTTQNPFTIAPVAEGFAWVYIYARLDSGEIDYRRIFVNVQPDPNSIDWGSGGDGIEIA